MAIIAQPERLELLNFFRHIPNTQFVIPVYQRNYIWTYKREVKKYLQDFESILNKSKQRHFIGIIMYLKIERGIGFNEFSVVDGQQRLVTTFLLLYALKKLAIETKNNLIAEQINNQYLVNQYAKNDYDKLKLKPLVSDDNVFSKIISNEFDKITKEEQNTNVFKNYKYISDYVKQLYGKYSIEEMLNTLDGFYIVAIPLDSENDDAQKIFETINSAGAALSKSDLIRNYILMNIQSSEQEKLYTDYWQPLEKLFEQSGKIEHFFRMFLANRNYSLCNMDEIYDVFQTWYNNYTSNHTIKEALDLIFNYAHYYYDLFVARSVDISPTIDKSLIEFKKNAVEPSAPLLLEIYDLYKKKDINNNSFVSAENFSKIIQLFNIYTIRRNICNQRTGILTRIVPLMLKTVIDNCNGDYSNIYKYCVKYLVDDSKGKQSFMPDDEYLRSALRGANVYALRNYLFTIFEKIELYNNPAPVDFSKLSIEHLMPQKPTEEWLKVLNIKEDAYEYNLHRLGNLTLASESDNSKMSNNPFDYKKEVLASTNHLKMNIDILNKPKWGIEEINERTEELIDKICELYPYISFDNKEIINKYDIFLKTETCNISATIFPDSTIEIKPGSVFSKLYDNSIQQLLDEETVSDNLGKYAFSQVYSFPTLENATSFFLPDNEIDSWEIWTDKNGDSLNLDVRVRLANKK